MCVYANKNIWQTWLAGKSHNEIAMFFFQLAMFYCRRVNPPVIINHHEKSTLSMIDHYLPLIPQGTKMYEVHLSTFKYYCPLR